METTAVKNEKINSESRKMTSFIVFIIFEFGESYKMDKQEAYFYLKKYGGLKHLSEHCWALHTENPWLTIRE